MICGKCGNEIKPGAKFCAKCGAGTQGAVNPATKQKRKPSFLVGFLCGFLAMLILAGGAFAGWKLLAEPAEEPVIDEGEETVRVEELESAREERVEGAGFDSPQRAVGAYLEAMKTGDVNEMLATFAVETYVDHYDMAAAIDQTRALSFSAAKQQFQPVDSFTRDLNVIRRTSEISESFVWQYEVMSGKDVDELLQIITLSESSPYDNGAEVAADIVNPDWLGDLDKIIIDEIHELSEFAVHFEDIHYDERFTETVKAWGSVYGCDEIRCMVVVLSYDNVDYYFAADVARYGNAWYMLDANGLCGTLMGMTVNSGGMTLTEEFW